MSRNIHVFIDDDDNDNVDKNMYGIFRNFVSFAVILFLFVPLYTWINFMSESVLQYVWDKRCSD